MGADVTGRSTTRTRLEVILVPDPQPAAARTRSARRRARPARRPPAGRPSFTTTANRSSSCGSCFCAMRSGLNVFPAAGRGRGHAQRPGVDRDRVTTACRWSVRWCGTSPVRSTKTCRIRPAGKPSKRWPPRAQRPVGRRDRQGGRQDEDPRSTTRSGTLWPGSIWSCSRWPCRRPRIGR